MNNINELVVGKRYLLTTVDYNGNPERRENWIPVTWTGQILIDDTGVHWNEWLSTPEDIHIDEIKYCQYVVELFVTHIPVCATITAPENASLQDLKSLLLKQIENNNSQVRILQIALLN